MADTLGKWVSSTFFIDMILIGNFLGKAIYMFYEDSFTSLISPILEKIIPGHKDDIVTIFGVEIKPNDFFVSIMRLLISILIAYYLRAYLLKKM